MGQVHRAGSCGVGFVCDLRGLGTHETVAMGVEAVRNLTHRGAVGADGKTGDGAGLLIQIPRKLFLKEMGRAGYALSDIGNLAVGAFFLSDALEREIEELVRAEGIGVAGWRDVPTDDGALGQSALRVKPRIRHLLMDMEGIPAGERELRLYFARRAIEKAHESSVYVSSFSSRTIVYKGMLVAPHLEGFYPDLLDGDVESAFAVFHQRFSTNTFPEWRLAQPLRVLAHNGEINTIQGNRNWMFSLEHELMSESFKGREELIRPLVSREESDSASLDRVVELLWLSGHSLEHAVNLCIPPVWETVRLSAEARAFFEYQSMLMKPWDGPAALTFTDGVTLGAHLDRNGLRPLRYVLSSDGILVVGSEAGMVDLGGRRVAERGRLGPGDTMAVDTERGTLKRTDEILRELSEQRPYGQWMDRHLVRTGKPVFTPPERDTELLRKQIAFGYGREELETVLPEAARAAKELVYSMGDDTPLPCLSGRPQLLFRYFKERFSQVTNPPIDSIRERMVTSLRMNLGHKRNFLAETPEHARRLQIESPLLLENQLKEIEGHHVFKPKRLSMTYPGGGEGLSAALERLGQEAVEAVEGGSETLVLSDRDISRERAAMPSLLALSASFKALQRRRLVGRTALVVETGEVRDVHQLACLIGYGAAAVHPYLAFQGIGELSEKGVIPLPPEKAFLNYKRAMEDGLLKVITRMGISTLNSYQGAQLFDAVGLNADFIDRFFTGTPYSLEADGLREIEGSVLQRHALGFETPEPSLEYGGTLRQRAGGEGHAWSPEAVRALIKCTRSADFGLYREFSRIASGGPPLFIRHLLAWKAGREAAPEEIEPEDSILKRFVTGAMSVGSLSPEVHETIAEACNRLGIRSNSGEGGENPLRYWEVKGSAIKQVASGRFGVTPAYLASARELEIKIAQGAKPGEGGHLPQNKVSPYIAMLRHCPPNILLISPPPHHDIYSIEDLAQLVHDLKQSNPGARVCVKLVAETGVGTVAAGVAKAYADVVQISGCDGGTGAATLSSIRNAGNYWEIGLSETQKVLVENGLRERIRVRVDGGMRTGRDVVMAALLGAEEFGFGTAAMIAAGCVMARKCHLNTCPTGIATQDEALRARFSGKAENVMAYFRAVAREVREILGGMGVRSLDEIIGRTELLREAPSAEAGKRVKVRGFLEGISHERRGAPRCTSERNDNPAPSMNDRLAEDLMPFIERAEPVEREYGIRNTDRSIPVRLNYHIARKYRDQGLPADTLRLTFRGTAGQSFGAFNHRGLSLTLIGEANDYAAKGMFGGRIVIRPSRPEEAHRQVIVGNTVLYGATGGEFYASGQAGERFAVRNSGAQAVVEGTGHHLCEYMTGGTVVVLGEVGYNVGAGMTGGGVIYIFDERDALDERINPSYVTAGGLDDEDEVVCHKGMLEAHHGYTGSERAAEMLSDFERYARHFKKVASIHSA
jgi:glutamate synthase (NADPH/NADH) large chain